MAKKVIPFPGSDKAAPAADGGPAMKPRKHSAENGAVVIDVLKERRDFALARKMTVQNLIVLGGLVDRDIVKRILGRISGAWRSTILEHSFTTVPAILALLKISDPAADAHLRSWFDDEIYAVGGRVNRAMEKWLQSQEKDNGE
jgi:hypothetical protein